jgi:protein arginine kinase activator
MQIETESEEDRRYARRNDPDGRLSANAYRLPIQDAMKNPNPGTPEPQDPSSICDKCGQRPAEVKVTEVDKHGKSVESRLCVECARSRGVVAQDVGAASQPRPVADKSGPQSAAEILRELKDKVRVTDRKLVCPNCKMTFNEFKTSGRLGCARCYDAFAEQLSPVIKRIHGAAKHTGRRPNPDGSAAAQGFEIQRLRRELSAAIEAENYEQAAAVRDRIRRAGGEGETQ